MALGDGIFRNFIGRSQHANIDRGLTLAAQATQLAVFQNAQQFGLRADRHLANLVEQQGTALGQLEAADAALERPGERAFLMAEDFAFNQRLRDSSAVDGDEWLRLAGTERVNGAGDQLFASAALAGDEYRCGAGRNHFNQAKDFLHALGRSDQRAENSDVAQLAPAGFQFAFRTAQTRGVLKNVAQPGGVHRLLDEVEGAAPHGGHGGIDAALRGQQNDGNLLGLRGDTLEQLHAVHARHTQIGDDNARIPDLDSL